MTLSATLDYIHVKRLGTDEKTPGGLFIPENAKEKSMFARIVSIGRGHLLPNGTVYPIDFEIGEIVLVDRYAGIEVVTDDGKILIIKEKDIMGVVE